MSRKIKINCKKVYDVGNFYQESADKIRKMKNDLLEISANISTSWQGVDSNNFNSRFNSHIEYLDNLINFLEAKSTVLKKTSTAHNVVDSDFSERMKRNDVNG